MCFPKVKTPTPQVQAPLASSPPPASSAAEVAEAKVDTDSVVEKAKRRGRNALVIPLQMGGTAGGTGLNIPTS